MPLESATALVLRVVPWSETSFVVTLFTRESGKVRGVAKGARRPKGPFESALDVLALCKVVFLRKSSEALDVLTEAKLLRRFRLQGRSLAALYAGYYVAELLHELTDDYDPHPELFDAANDTLAALPSESDAARRTLRFELAALRLLGHLPSLTRCSECGQTIEAAGRVAFSPLAGGALCDNCRRGKRQVISLSAQGWRALTTLADTTDAWRDLPLQRTTQGELRSVMNQVVAGLLGHQPRLHDYLR
jgi:DNA repair protein RecO (recombination protein O)